MFEYLLRSSQPSTLVQSRQARRDYDEDEEEIDDDDDDIVPGTLVLSKQARRGGKVHLDGDSTYDHRWVVNGKVAVMVVVMEVLKFWLFITTWQGTGHGISNIGENKNCLAFITCVSWPQRIFLSI